MVGGGTKRVQHETSVVGETVEITNSADKFLRLQPGNTFERGGGIKPGRSTEIFSTAKEVVKLDADFELPEFPMAIVAVGGKYERQRVGVRTCQSGAGFFLDACFT